MESFSVLYKVAFILQGRNWFFLSLNEKRAPGALSVIHSPDKPLNQDGCVSKQTSALLFWKPSPMVSGYLSAPMGCAWHFKTFGMVSLAFANWSSYVEVVCISFPCGRKMRFCCKVNPFWWLFCSPWQRNEVIVVEIIILILFWGRLWTNNRRCWFVSENELQLIEIWASETNVKSDSWWHFISVTFTILLVAVSLQTIIRHKWRVLFSTWNLKYFYYESCMIARVKD